MSKLLSVIIANRNDTAMLSVTVNSCIEEFRPIGFDKCEIVICDNSDKNIANLMKSCLPIGWIREGVLRLRRQDFPCLFTAREDAIKNATGKYICCLDSHMLVGRDMFVDLLSFMERHQSDESLGFAHAPVNWSHHHSNAAVHDRDMSVNELGNWNRRYKNERTITWKGMPWICRRDWFLNKDSGLGAYGALSQHKVSWGGGDLHIGVKPWLLGFKNWAVPCNSAIHIGPFPKINRKTDNSAEIDESDKCDYRYRLYGNSGNYPHAFGFLVSCYVLGGEKMMNRNKAAIQERFGRYIDQDKWWHKAMEIGSDEKRWLDNRKVMSFEQLLETRPWDG